MDIKPGYQTSEFWVVLATKLVALAVLFGVVKPDAAETLSAALTQCVTAAFVVGGVIAVSLTYMRGRHSQKEAAAVGRQMADARAVAVQWPDAVPLP